MSPKPASASVDRSVAQAATQTAGILTTRELVKLGMSRRALSRRVAASRLFRLHHGVYSTVPPSLLTSQARWLAAVKACGEGAVLSHMSAAAVWDLTDAFVSPIHVTVPTEAGRARRDGIVIHRSPDLSPSQTAVKAGVPVTKPGRTLHDLRRVVPRGRLEDLVRRAERLHLDTAGVHDLAPEPAGNALERRLMALCRRHGLPHPRVQELIGPYVVDFLWPEARLVVEVDGFATHGLRSSFEADRTRDAWLMVRGYRVVRFTWRQLHGQPAHVVQTLRTLLGLAAGE
jgi:very-short-patch-repair endonuclease